MINYNSALKVVNLGEPEASLILRKPRSPQGQGGRRAVQPHRLDPRRRAAVGKHGTPGLSSDPRLDPRSLQLGCGSRRDPRHSPPIATRLVTSRPRPATATSATIWHTEFVGATPGYPHELVVDLGSPRNVEGLLYVPRQDMSNGRVKDFEVRVSDDGKTWSKPLASGRWTNDPAFKYVALAGLARARYRPASRPERGRRPTVHERGRAVRRLTSLVEAEPYQDISGPDLDMPVAGHSRNRKRGVSGKSR